MCIRDRVGGGGNKRECEVLLAFTTPAQLLLLLCYVTAVFAGRSSLPLTHRADSVYLVHVNAVCII